MCLLQLLLKVVALVGKFLVACLLLFQLSLGGVQLGVDLVHEVNLLLPIQANRGGTINHTCTYAYTHIRGYTCQNK